MPISLYQPLNSNNSNIKKKEKFLIIIIIIMIIIYYLYCANSTDVYMIKCASAIVKVPRVININFLPTIFVQNQAEGLLELTK